MKDIDELSIRGPMRQCPICDHDLDSVTPAYGDERIEPEDGDVTICFYCAMTLVFRGGVASVPTPEEQVVFMNDPNILRVQHHILISKMTRT